MCDAIPTFAYCFDKVQPDSYTFIEVRVPVLHSQPLQCRVPGKNFIQREG